jgi:hypothetical protein
VNIRFSLLEYCSAASIAALDFFRLADSSLFLSTRLHLLILLQFATFEIANKFSEPIFNWLKELLNG